MAQLERRCGEGARKSSRFGGISNTKALFAQVCKQGLACALEMPRPYCPILSVRYSRTLLTWTRSCFSVSRSRTVTV